LVVADATRRQIGTLFEIEDLGFLPLMQAERARSITQSHIVLVY